MPAADPWAKAPERFLLAPIYHEVAAVIGWAKAVKLGWWVWMNRRSPSRLKKYRAGVLYVPYEMEQSEVMAAVSEVIGDDASRRLVAEFGGSSLLFTSPEPASIPRRDRALLEQLDDGGRLAVVACAFGVSARTARRIYQRQTGKPFVRMKRRNQELRA